MSNSAPALCTIEHVQAVNSITWRMVLSLLALWRIARKWRVFKTASIYVAITTHSCSLLRVKKQLDVHGVVLVYTHIFPEVYIISSLAKTIRPFPLFLQVGNVHGKLCCFSFHWELELKDSPSCGNAHIVVLINLF